MIIIGKSLDSSTVECIEKNIRYDMHAVCTVHCSVLKMANVKVFIDPLHARHCRCHCCCSAFTLMNFPFNWKCKICEDVSVSSFALGMNVIKVPNFVWCKWNASVSRVVHAYVCSTRSALCSLYYICKKCISKWQANNKLQRAQWPKQ